MQNVEKKTQTTTWLFSTRVSLLKNDIQKQITEQIHLVKSSNETLKHFQIMFLVKLQHCNPKSSTRRSTIKADRTSPLTPNSHKALATHHWMINLHLSACSPSHIFRLDDQHSIFIGSLAADLLDLVPRSKLVVLTLPWGFLKVFDSTSQPLLVCSRRHLLKPRLLIRYGNLTIAANQRVFLWFEEIWFW